MISESFTDNLIPNGYFDEGPVKWTPDNAITSEDPYESAFWSLRVGGVSYPSSCSSDVFTIPPGQTLSFSGYTFTYDEAVADSVVVTMKIVAPQQQTLFEFKPEAGARYHQFSKTFKSGDVPMDCKITLSNTSSSAAAAGFASLSLVCV